MGVKIDGKSLNMGLPLKVGRHVHFSSYPLPPGLHTVSMMFYCFRTATEERLELYKLGIEEYCQKFGGVDINLP